MYLTNKQDRTRSLATVAFAMGLAMLSIAAQAVVSIPAQAPSTTVTNTTLLTDTESTGTNFPWSAQLYTNNGVTGAGSTVWDSSVGHNAMGSAKLTMGATPGVNFIYTLPSTVSFNAGSRYAVQVWVKSDTNNASLDFMIRGGGDGFFPYAVQHVVATTSWQLVTIQGIPPESGTTLMASNATLGAKFWMDDMVVTKITKNEYAPLNTTSAIPSTLFGMHINKVLTPNLPWPAEGQNIIRLHDTGTTWCDIETTVHASDPPTYNTTRLDNIISYLTAGFNSTGNTQAGVIYTMGQTPQIYASTPNVGGNYYCTALGNTGASSPPADMTKWDNYVSFIGNHLKGKVKYYEIWNEWDISGNYSLAGSAGVAAMVTMTQHAYTILKQIDPTIVVLSPSITARNGPLLLEQFLSAGGGAYVDAINFHGTLTNTPDQFISQIENIRSIMANHQVGTLPIVDTEGSMMCDPHSPYTGFECPSSGPSTTQVNAFPLLNSLLLWDRGAVNFNYYTWEGIEGDASELVYGVDPANMPVPSGCNPYACTTPLGTIYAQAVSWLKNATVTDGYKIAGAVNGESIYVFKMKDSAGRFEVVMWADGSGESVQLDSTWSTLLNTATLNGSTVKTTIPSSRVLPVSNTPILLTSF